MAQNEGTKKIQFYFLSLSMLLQFSLLGLLNPYIAIFFRKEGLPFSILFLIFFANYIGNLFQPVWGILSDKFDQRKIFLIISTFIWVIALIVIRLFPEFLIFVIFFGIASLFGSASQPVSRSLISLLASKEEETEYQSKFGVLLTTAFSISSWAGGLIISTFSFDVLFSLTAFLSILSFIFIFTVKEHHLNHKSSKINDDEEIVKPIPPKKDVNYRERASQLIRNRYYLLIIFCSGMGGFAFYFFLNFFSVFYVESGGRLPYYSWALVISFILFMICNYLGELIMKRKTKSDSNKQKNISKIKFNHINEEISMHLGFSEKLKVIFIFWSILGFCFLCFLLVLYPIVPLFMILIIYSLPIVPFFFTSMLALTTRLVKPEQKALAVGIQGVLVFGGRSLAVFLGSQVLDWGGFNMAPFIDIFLLGALFIMVFYSLKKINII